MSDNELASSADEGSDAEKAEALNAKVQRVMAPCEHGANPAGGDAEPAAARGIAAGMT